MKDFLKQAVSRSSLDTEYYPKVSDVMESLEILGGAGPHVGHAATAEPIFLLATGWRTGSTLLQRILMTDRRVLLWGEPLGRTALISRVAESLTAITPTWPKIEECIDKMSGELTTSWIANLYPPFHYLRAGLQSLLTEWLAAPAQQREYSRWGLKEVRLGAVEACILRWLFPKAMFVVLLRHPFDAYLSIKRISPSLRLWLRWPDSPIASAADYGRHWNRMALSWKDLPDDFPRTVIKYEELISSDFNFRHLEKELKLEIDEDMALAARVGRGRKPGDLSRYDRKRLLKETRSGMEMYGYDFS